MFAALRHSIYDVWRDRDKQPDPIPVENYILKVTEREEDEEAKAEITPEEKAKADLDRIRNVQRGIETGEVKARKLTQQEINAKVELLQSLGAKEEDIIKILLAKKKRHGRN